MKTTGTILQKCSPLCGEKQGIELVLVASQDSLWYEEKAGEMDLIEETHWLFFLQKAVCGWGRPEGRALDIVVNTTAINLGWLREK